MIIGTDSPRDGEARQGRYQISLRGKRREPIQLTGTGVVPGDDFTLLAEDVVRISISGIGELRNPVVMV